MSQPQRFLVTIDRDCRTIYCAEQGSTRLEPVVELPQGLDPVIERALSEDARKWNRGLKTIRPYSGGWVVCDLFGVYRLSPDFKIERYLSIPQFTDIHSALPYGDRMLISNTGIDQVLWVDWQGRILETIDLHRWYPATPWMEHDLEVLAREVGGDLRLLPLDWARESCHVNWAEESPLGTMISCFVPGEILFFKDGWPVHRLRAAEKCHGPRFLAQSRTVIYLSSEANRIVETDLAGEEVWSADGFAFAKSIHPLADGTFLVADTGNRRIVQVDRKTKGIVWECPVPGTPYDVQPWIAG